MSLPKSKTRINVVRYRDDSSDPELVTQISRVCKSTPRRDRRGRPQTVRTYVTYSGQLCRVYRIYSGDCIGLCITTNTTTTTNKGV